MNAIYDAVLSALRNVRFAENDLDKVKYYSKVHPLDTILEDLQGARVKMTKWLGDNEC